MIRRSCWNGCCQNGVWGARGQGLQVLPLRWLVEWRLAWLLCCRRLLRCYEALCVAAWTRVAGKRRLVRWMANKKC